VHRVAFRGPTLYALHTELHSHMYYMYSFVYMCGALCSRCERRLPVQGMYKIHRSLHILASTTCTWTLSICTFVHVHICFSCPIALAYQLLHATLHRGLSLPWVACRLYSFLCKNALTKYNSRLAQPVRDAHLPTPKLAIAFARNSSLSRTVGQQ
jgi:hypothetical protein